LGNAEMAPGGAGRERGALRGGDFVQKLMRRHRILKTHHPPGRHGGEKPELAGRPRWRYNPTNPLRTPRVCAGASAAAGCTLARLRHSGTAGGVARSVTDP